MMMKQILDDIKVPDIRRSCFGYSTIICVQLSSMRHTGLLQAEESSLH